MRNVFKLECVTCKTVIDLPAEKCKEQPFCERCYSPLVLKNVTIAPGKKKKYAQ